MKLLRYVSIVAVLVLVVALAWGSLAQDDMMSTGEQVEAIVETLWNEGDLDGIADWIAEDVTVYLPPSLGVDPPFAGHEGYSINVMGWRAGLPDMNIEIVTVVSGEASAAARVIITGTQTEEFFGIPPTNAELAFGANIIYIFNDDGLLVEEWWEWDTVLELVQLGLFTPPGQE